MSSLPEKSQVTYQGKTVTITDYWGHGPKLIELPRFNDSRGMFMESFNEVLFSIIGIPTSWPQDNLSHSKKGVIRGMHVQSGPKPQGKLIHCLSGAIQDVAIDLRKGSLTWGKTFSVVLRADSELAQMFYVPPGFAHGFLALQESLISYKCTTIYDPTKDSGINPLASGIKWIVERETGSGFNGLVSAKDQALPSLIDYRNRHA